MNLTGLFGELVYALHKAVPDDDSRKEVYDHMIDSFIEVADTVDFKDCKGSDPVFDELIKDRFDEDPPEIEEEYDDD